MLSQEQYSRKEMLLCELGRKDGEEHYGKQKFTKALNCYNQALRHVPDDIKALVGRSRCYSKLRKLRRAVDDVDMALHLDATDKEALLQKGNVLDQLGNHEMALVYYHRGLKRYPRAQEFKDAIEKSEKRSTRKGRRMRLTSTGDLSYFTSPRKAPPPKQFQWKKPEEKVPKSLVPSANFRSRIAQGPLTRVHRQPSVHLSESRATSINSLLADSLESLAYEDRLVEESTEKGILGKMYDDKEYLEFLLGADGYKNKKTPLGTGEVAVSVENGLQFLQERTKFWDSLGPLPPPHPSRRAGHPLGSRSQMSIYTSTESLNTIGTQDSSNASTFRSNKTTNSKYSTGTGKGSKYRSRYAFGKRKEKAPPPKPEKIKFDFSSYRRDEEMIREMTLIPEEGDPSTSRTGLETEREKTMVEAKKRGEEVKAFVEEEITVIDKYFDRGQLDLCRKRADSCIDVLGRYTEDEVPAKHILLSTLYSCLGNCDMTTKDYPSAIENHTQDLMIGEQCNNAMIQSRALGNLGRTHVLMGRYNRALDMYNRKAPLCKSPKETSWLFHEIGNCFLMMKIYEYAHESGLKALRSAHDANHRRLQLQAYVLVAVAEVNLMRYKEAYQHFEEALDRAKLLDDKRAQDAMTRALVDVNKKMVTQMKKKKSHHGSHGVSSEPVHYDIPLLPTPVSRGNTMSAKTNITVEG